MTLSRSQVSECGDTGDTGVTGDDGENEPRLFLMFCCMRVSGGTGALGSGGGSW